MQRGDRRVDARVLGRARDARGGRAARAGRAASAASASRSVATPSRRTAARALGAALVVARRRRASGARRSRAVTSVQSPSSSGTGSIVERAEVDAQRVPRAPQQRRELVEQPVSAPTQSFSTREHSRASSTRSAVGAPAAPSSARHSAASSAAEDDRPEPCGQVAGDLEPARSAWPAARSSATAPRTNARQPSAARRARRARSASSSPRSRAPRPRPRRRRRRVAVTVTPRVDRERQREAAVVVGVLADQVHAAGPERARAPLTAAPSATVPRSDVARTARRPK